MKRALLLLAAASSLATSGCPATWTETPVEPTFSSLSKHVFVGCSTQNCHGGLNPKANMSLEPSKAYASLVGKQPDNEQARTDGLMRVAAGEPDKSFLLIKLHPITQPAYGERMPQGGRLTDTQIAVIRQWIEMGAPND